MLKPVYKRLLFPPTTCSFLDVQNTTIIQTAFEDLVSQLDITLTESGRRAIHYINQPSITAESSLSKGIVAQENGRLGEALSFYYNAATFMPNTKEINSRISVLSSNVSGGDIGQNARNLIALRNSWLEILSECDDFLNEHIPFEIIYDPTLKQEGKINYSSGTVDLGFSIMTKPTEGFNMINDVLKGLKKTGKQEEWGFQFWPFLDSPLIYKFLPSGGYAPLWMSHERRVFYENRELIIEVALLDKNGQIISEMRDIIMCNMGTRTYEETWMDLNERGTGFFWKQIAINVNPEKTKKRIVFKNVDANKITDTMTLKILSVDGIDAETVGINGYIRISTGKV